MEKPEFRQEPRQDGQLEDDAHHEREHQEIVHVAVERQLVGDCRRQLVGIQETQRQGENEAVAHHAAGIEKRGAKAEGEPHAPFLVAVKCGAHKAPQLEDDVWETDQQREPKRQLTLEEELRCQPEVDYRHVERLDQVAWHRREMSRQGREPVVKEEVVGRRGHHHVVEEPRDEGKAGYQHYRQHRHDAHEHPAQHLEMIPKRGFAISACRCPWLACRSCHRHLRSCQRHRRCR